METWKTKRYRLIRSEKMSKKAVFFDIDGTLYDFRTGVIESTKKAIKKIRENGHLAIICTGRSKAMLPEEEVISLGFDGVIAGCGTYIDYDEKNVLNETIKLPLVLDTVKLLKENHLIPILEGPEYIYFDKEGYEGKVREALDKFSYYLGDRSRPIAGNETDINANKISVRLLEHSKLDKIQKSLQMNYNLIFHESTTVELVPKKYSKAKGIEILIDKLEIKREDTYAFGDSNNDLEMIRYVAHGVAMGNSTKDLLKIADYVTDDIEKDGIYNGLLKLGLL